MARPNVVDLATRAVSEVVKEPVGFLTAGLAPMAIGLVAGVGGVIVAYGAIIAGSIPGVLSDDPDEGMLLGMGIGLGIFVPLMVGLVLVVTPMMASVQRAVWRYLVHGEKLTAGAPFSTFTQDLGRVVVFNLLQGLAVAAGILLCYVPGLVISGLLVFAAPAIYVHRLGIGEAVGLSIRSAQEEPAWHLGFFGISFVILLVLQYIPIVGLLLIYTAHPLFVLLAYRELFGDGERPRGFEI